MASTTASKVADFILCHMRDNGDFVSNLKMQKLVYYAQAWFLALFDEPLFDEPIQAWIHGPVQPGLFRRFEKYGWKPILDEPKCPNFKDKRIKPHLLEVLDVYGDLTAHYLSQLTHQEEPWRVTRGELAPDVSSESVISHKTMRDFYRILANKEL